MADPGFIPSPYAAGNMQPAAPTHREISFTRSDRISAWLSLAAAIFYARCMLAPDEPMRAFLLTLIFYAIAGFALISRKAAVPKSALWLPVSSLMFSASYFLHDHSLIHFLAFQWAKVSCLLFVMLGFHASQDPIPDEFFVLDLIKAVIVQPFARFFSLFAALIPKGEWKGRKHLAWVMLGLTIAIVPCFWVIRLLGSFDSGFAERISGFFRGDWLESILQEIVYWVIGLPIAMYFFSSLISNSQGVNGELWLRDQLRRDKAKTAIAPVTFGAALMIPILLIYCLFFVVQWEEYLFAFLFRLPSTFESYSAYARDGFFQLCLVAAINGGLMLAVQHFVRKDEKGNASILIRVLLFAYAIATLGLLVTALSKMSLYIHMYGYTSLRVYTTWFMLALFFGFVAAAVSVITPKLRLMPVVIAIGLFFFGAVCLHDTHQWIAQINIDSYVQEGKELDIYALNELNDGAVGPVLDAVYAGIFADDPELEERAHRYLCEKAWDEEHEEEREVLSWTPLRQELRARLRIYRLDYRKIYEDYAEHTRWSAHEEMGLGILDSSGKE